MFYKTLSKVTKIKSGFHFCSRAHKDQAQRIGGIKEIMPPHYGTAKLEDYRLKAFDFYKAECKKCGWKEYPQVLEVNHIDCNRKNNSIENLEILCPTCHRVYHFTTKTGCWAPKS
jgi:5-methylcytosine-specific restriction endonuclease McrA